MAEADQGRIAGRVSRVIFANPDSLFTVAVITDDQGRDQICVGDMGALAVGERLIVHGQYQTHPRHGRQFTVEHFHIELPQTVDGLKAYLGSGLIPGLGPKLAERIIDKFGPGTTEVIHQQPERLIEVSGIGRRKLAVITAALEQKRALEGLIVFLTGHGLPAGLAKRLHQAFGPKALAKVRDDPYLLAYQVRGIGFARADELALKLGLGHESPLRIRAGLRQVLAEAAGQGDLYVAYNELIDRAGRMLNLDRELIIKGAAEEMVAQRLIAEDLNRDLEAYRPDHKAVYLPRLHEAESVVASALSHLAVQPLKAAPRSLEKMVAAIEGRLKINLAPEQKQALAAVVGHSVSIITGGPGTGKTTLIRALIALLDRLDLKAALAAPTGRAAKRMSQASGRPAATLHRLLEYRPEVGFQRNQARPLTAEVIIVDEASMIDINLMAHLAAAVSPGSRLVLVGDIDQLPPVGPGQPLADLITSGRVNVVRLETIFRQAERSRIVANAHRIRLGKGLSDQPADDFFFIRRNEPDRAAETIVELTADRIPNKFCFHPFTEIQVLSPMHRGSAGITELNRLLKAALNPTGAPTAYNRFNLGDKVIQTRNNYDLDVFNGDLGQIVDQEEEGGLKVDFDGEIRLYAPPDVDDLDLAYCMSIHKSQGSEYRAVVLPLLSEHFIMLNRRLLYTAVTRARDLVVIVGQEKALRLALTKEQGLERRSLLADKMQVKFASGSLPD